MRDLSGQTAIVTGAGSGVGRGISTVLASEGAAVVAVDLDRDRAETTAQQIGEAGGEALAVTGDVSVAADVARMVAAALEWKDGVEILASNVGIYPTAPIEAIDDESWDRVMAVNVRASFMLMRELLPTMRRQRYGRIVLTSSITGPITAMPTVAHYAASKAALSGLIRVAALEFAGAGITVNAVLPGTVDTEGLRATGGQKFIDAMLPSIPIGRLANGEDLGWMVRMLASPEAAYVTGVEIPVDGGMTIPEGRASTELLEEVLYDGDS